MKSTYSLIAVSLGLLACSTNSSDRAPAANAAPVPYVPVKPGTGHGPQPVPSPTTVPGPVGPAPSEATVDPDRACREKPISVVRRGDGQPLTIGSMLNGLKLAPGSIVTKGTFFIRWEQDPATIRSIFAASTGVRGRLFEMAEYSPAFQAALNFANMDQLGHRRSVDRAPARSTDVLTEGRTAWIVAALLSAGADTECVNFVLRAADGLLSAEIVADLRNLPFAESAKMSPEALRTSFGTLEKNHQDRQRELLKIKRSMELNTSKHDLEVTKLRAELQKKTNLLLRDLLKEVKDPKCQREIANYQRKTAGTSYASGNVYRRSAQREPAKVEHPEVPDVREVLQSCEGAIQAKLTSNTIKLTEAETTLVRLCARREIDCDPEDESSGRDKPQVARARDSIKSLTEKNEELTRYLEFLQGSADTSVQTTLEDIDQARDEYEDNRYLTDYNSTLESQRKTILDQQAVEAPKWLVQGTLTRFNGNVVLPPQGR